MRTPLERSRIARFALALAAVGAVLPLAGSASATDEFAFRLESLRLWSLGSELRPALAPSDGPAIPSVHHRRARRIWAAARTRPLRAASARRAPVAHLAARRPAAPLRVAQGRPAAEPQVVFPKLIVLPKPPRPALVSIYQDRTLRDGDAVMMADGIRVFHGAGAWPHRPRDFVRLTFAAALDWRLRETLDVLDRNPPVRWSSMGGTAG